MQGRLTAAACFAACLAAAIEARATHVCPGRPNGTVDFGPFPDPPFQHAHAIGAPCPDASATAEAGAIALAGGGFDIGQDGDQLLFAYSVAPGDFSARVTVAAKNLVPGSRWGKFGIMARQDCSDRSRYTLIHDCGENLEDNTRLSHRPTHGGSDNFETVPAGNFKHARSLRLDRRGGVFTAYVLDETGDFGTAPGTWLEVGRNDWGFTAPPAVLLGLAVSSHSEC
ncbi:MAG: hypothetical protein HY721_18950, partial [Planctomycetes bacterium]|nr:hypothetical protein [Planctomycetota bacterium]